MENEKKMMGEEEMKKMEEMKEMEEMKKKQMTAGSRSGVGRLEKAQMIEAGKQAMDVMPETPHKGE